MLRAYRVVDIPTTTQMHVLYRVLTFITSPNGRLSADLKRLNNFHPAKLVHTNNNRMHHPKSTKAIPFQTCTPQPKRNPANTHESPH